MLCEDDENLKNDTTVKYELILRKWQELSPAYEFRCFVKDYKVIGKKGIEISECSLDPMLFKCITLYSLIMPFDAFEILCI